jgi:AraC family transcriptional regulator of adaptative response / DNA-3-methyladenine glycosylase II
MDVRLAVRQPFNGTALLEFLGLRVVPGIEATGDDWYARTFRLPHGHAVARLEFGAADHVRCELQLTDPRDVSTAVERLRWLVDADCDPVAVDESLGVDPAMAPLVRRRPGLRVPGHVDGDEVAVRAVLGQQISVKAAANAAGNLVQRLGTPIESEIEGITHLFPDAAAIAAVDPEGLRMPRSRGRALVGLCAALAEREIVLDRSAERADVRSALLALPGIGPWTADYIALRALGDPDVFLPTDLGVKHALPAGADPEAWRPWRSYALLHLWTTLSEQD